MTVARAQAELPDWLFDADGHWPLIRDALTRGRVGVSAARGSAAEPGPGEPAGRWWTETWLRRAGASRA